jgi:hypothetical protein
MPLLARLHLRLRSRLHAGLLALWETILLRRWKRQRALAWRIRGTVRKPKQVILVDPRAIDRTARLRPGGQVTAVERPVDVVSGTWRVGMIVDDRDLLVGPPVDENWAVQACRERWLEGKDWKDTAYREGYAGYVQRGLVRDWDEFAATRLAQWDALFASLVAGPYRMKDNPKNEVQVAIAGNGEILFCDGKHRLTAARILGYGTIPVIVNFWSKAFVDRVGPGLTPREMTRFLRGGGGATGPAPPRPPPCPAGSASSPGSLGTASPAASSGTSASCHPTRAAADDEAGSLRAGSGPVRRARAVAGS